MLILDYVIVILTSMLKSKKGSNAEVLPVPGGCCRDHQV